MQYKLGNVDLCCIISYVQPETILLSLVLFDTGYEIDRRPCLSLSECWKSENTEQKTLPQPYSNAKHIVLQLQEFTLYGQGIICRAAWENHYIVISLSSNMTPETTPGSILRPKFPV